MAVALGFAAYSVIPAKQDQAKEPKFRIVEYRPRGTVIQERAYPKEEGDGDGAHE